MASCGYRDNEMNAPRISVIILLFREVVYVAIRVVTFRSCALFLTSISLSVGTGQSDSPTLYRDSPGVEWHAATSLLRQ